MDLSSFGELHLNPVIIKRQMWLISLERVVYFFLKQPEFTFSLVLSEDVLRHGDEYTAAQPAASAVHGCLSCC